MRKWMMVMSKKGRKTDLGFTERERDFELFALADMALLFSSSQGTSVKYVEPQ